MTDVPRTTWIENLSGVRIRALHSHRAEAANANAADPALTTTTVVLMFDPLIAYQCEAVSASASFAQS